MDSDYISLKEKYRKHPQSLSEGWGSYSNLPTEEKILIPDQYLSSPRTIYPYYGSMRPRILSTSGIDEVFDWKTQDEEFSGQYVSLYCHIYNNKDSKRRNHQE